jgi:prepilin-type N-terminal cleavage/methylation domain-containing protein
MPVINNKQSGFTLVEMSIVLVIIGLIVSGVLVGQDLVKNAQVRSTIQQIEGYNAAVNTFAGKYNCMPGDCAKAAVLIPNLSNLAGGTVGGAPVFTPNGNGRLDDVVATPAAGVVTAGFQQELKAFWEHLSKASMVNGNFLATAAAAVSASGANFPIAKLKKGGIIAASEGTDNLWVVGVDTASAGINAAATWIPAGTSGKIAPLEAFGIDSKMDDGIANTGVIQVATASTAASFTRIGTTASNTTAGSETCWNWNGVAPAATTPVDYQVTAERDICAITIRIQN